MYILTPMIEHSLDDNCPSYIWHILYVTWTSIPYFGGYKLFWSRVYIKVWRVIEVCKAERRMRGPKLSLLICPMPSEFILPHEQKTSRTHHSAVENINFLIQKPSPDLDLHCRLLSLCLCKKQPLQRQRHRRRRSTR